jgi:hypothetical protein
MSRQLNEADLLDAFAVRGLRKRSPISSCLSNAPDNPLAERARALRKQGA